MFNFCKIKKPTSYLIEAGFNLTNQKIQFIYLPLIF